MFKESSNPLIKNKNRHCEEAQGVDVAISQNIVLL